MATQASKVNRVREASQGCPAFPATLVPEDPRVTGVIPVTRECPGWECRDQWDPGDCREFRDRRAPGAPARRERGDRRAYQGNAGYLEDRAQSDHLDTANSVMPWPNKQTGAQAKRADDIIDIMKKKSLPYNTSAHLK